MSRGLLIGSGVFLSVLVAGFFLLRSPAKNELSSSPIPSPITTSPSPSSQDPLLKEFTVTETEFSFSPTTINVKVGDKVKITFVNSGEFSHDFVIDELKIKTKEIDSGETDSIEFVADKAGSFTYYCGVKDHHEKGMEGKLVVLE